MMMVMELYKNNHIKIIQIFGARKTPRCSFNSYITRCYRLDQLYLMPEDNKNSPATSNRFKKMHRCWYLFKLCYQLATIMGLKDFQTLCSRIRWWLSCRHCRAFFIVLWHKIHLVQSITSDDVAVQGASGCFPCSYKSLNNFDCCALVSFKDVWGRLRENPATEKIQKKLSSMILTFSDPFIWDNASFPKKWN